MNHGDKIIYTWSDGFDEKLRSGGMRHKKKYYESHGVFLEMIGGKALIVLGEGLKARRKRVPLDSIKLKNQMESA